MKWRKQGKICDSSTFDVYWYRLNTMTPLPYIRQDGILRIYLTMCDEKNRGHVGYVDLDPDKCLKIVNYSKEPALGLGEIGMFDEDGVLPTSLIKEDGKLWLHYSAYQRQVNYPYNIFSGLAVSNDDGNSFTRVKKTPILDRTEGEYFQRSAVEIMKINSGYRIWYSCGSHWLDTSGKSVPKYNIHCMDSNNFFEWNSKSMPAVTFLNDDEYGLTMPQVWYSNGLYRMVYSIRSLSKGYRLGYAESVDGISFNRMDEKMKIDVSTSGFDSEMICFGKILEYAGTTYLFYCGNHYGRGGLGYAVLEDDA